MFNTNQSYKSCPILAAKPTQVQKQRKGISYDDKLLIHSTYDQLQYMCFELNDEDLQKMVIVSVFFSIDHLGVPPSTPLHPIHPVHPPSYDHDDHGLEDGDDEVDGDEDFEDYDGDDDDDAGAMIILRASTPGNESSPRMKTWLASKSGQHTSTCPRN